MMDEVQTDSKSLPGKLLARFRTNWRPGWVEWGFLVLVALALGMRLWELGGRTMHYDEAIHVYASWKLVNSAGALGGWPWIFGTDYIHSPWMHGPFQIELTAFIFRIFGDSDFTARLGYVLFGTGLVALPYFFRDYLGRVGALLAGGMLALSPVMLYFSRFGRNDILMAFWALALLILMWRYVEEGKHRYLYLTSAVLAFMFASKETAYIVTFVLGAAALVMAAPQLKAWALGRTKTSLLAGPAGFFLLLVTLTLPQWTALASLAQDALGLTLANPAGVSTGIVGAPEWGGSFVNVPVYDGAWWFHVLVAAGAVGCGLALMYRARAGISGLTALRIGVVCAAAGAVLMAIFRPLDGAWSFGPPVLDLVLAGALAGTGIGALIRERHPWRTGALLLIWPAQAAALYALLFTGVVDVASTVNGVLPSGISVEADANGVPVNYLVAGGLLLVTFNASVYLGLRWLQGRWLVAAGIFYFVWALLYTTVFTNLSGLFSGVWQGMGYWVAQQDYGRANQPWYYYFAGLPVYELLPLAFGLAGLFYFVRRRDRLGMVLAFWAAATLLAYTIASEKMPWLLVNISLPFVVLAGKFLGDLAERVDWFRILNGARGLLLVFPAIIAVAAVYLAYEYTNPETNFSLPHWALVGSVASIALAAAYLVRQAGPRNGPALAGLGLAFLLLGFGVATAIRAAYTYDDSNNELLVYAQGSNDLKETVAELDRRVLEHEPAGTAVEIDYDIWYPLNWYVRDPQKDGLLKFSCFKEEGEADWNSSCKPLSEEREAAALLIGASRSRDFPALSAYEEDGPHRSLLWFNEGTYRRPEEQRIQCPEGKRLLFCAGEGEDSEGWLLGLKGLPSGEQLSKDFGHFEEVAGDKEAWFEALDYTLFRNLEADWYRSDYYSYLPQ